MQTRDTFYDLLLSASRPTPEPAASIVPPDTTSPSKLSATEIAKLASKSVVLLSMEDASGRPISFGSGFYVNDKVIVTNLHVIKGTARGFAKKNNEKRQIEIEGVIGVDVDRDLVLLKMTERNPDSLIIGNSDLVQVGDAVYAMGAPKGFEGTFSHGLISSIREDGSDKIIQISAPTSPGSSGGPVLNEKAEVVGITFAGHKTGQNINFAIPSNYLKKLLVNHEFSKVLPLNKLMAQ